MKRIEKTVFISYRRTDGAWALQVFRELSRRGFDVFIDFESIGSGSFADIIIGNIRSRAHFLVVLTTTTLDRCTQPEDWLRLEIEAALASGRNIVPLTIGDFQLGDPKVKAQLTGNLAPLGEYNGLDVGLSYFDAAMERLVSRFLNIPTDAVIHPASALALQIARQQQRAADAQLRERFRRTRSKNKQLAVDLAEVNEVLRQFQCPKCGALQTEHGFGSQPNYSGFDEEWEFTSYECGYAVVDDRETRKCRNSPEGRALAKITEAKFTAAQIASMEFIQPFGDKAKARLLKDWDEELAENPNHLNALIQRAEAFLSTGNAHAAIKDIQRASELGGLRFANTGPPLKAMILHIRNEWTRMHPKPRRLKAEPASPTV